MDRFIFRTDNEQNWHMSGYPMKVTEVCFDHDGQNLYTASVPLSSHGA